MSDFMLPMPRARLDRERPWRRAWRTQYQVLWALMLHDIKSRFFGNGLGYVVTILWPATHIAIIVLIYVLGRRPVPYGNSALLYASIGIMPYITWNYMSRFTMMCMVQNRCFLAYPVIRPLDMMFSRLALECVSIFIIVTGLVGVNALAQVDVMPIDLGEAVCGLLSAVLLGVGFGVLNGVITMIFPLWVMGYVVILIVFWITAGLAMNPEAMPAEIGYWFSWNPLLHSIEWIRKGYYADFPAHLLDKHYVIGVGAGSLALGLLLERALRPYRK